jgi:D-beta-D-heptose 7-phosphate kinase/D-beta-D-heptose 1-phosphate adenosyltransferase
VDGVASDLVVVPSRPTTRKTRYLAGRHQILRADVEERGPAAEEELLAAFRCHLLEADAIVLSDYAKGVLSDRVVAEAIALARAAGKPTIADPKSAVMRRYDGAMLVTPNRNEAAAATQIAGDDDARTEEAAAAILAEARDIGAVLITRGPLGMTLLERGQPVQHFPATAREVFDVSGAGDTVVATLALGLAADLDLASAAYAANLAAGIAVTKIGTASVTPQELLGAFQSGDLQFAARKIATLATASRCVAEWRAGGARIGFTNGCFDLIHPGHVSLLTRARARCDRLIVAINTDASVKRLKGEGRPVQNEAARSLVLASMAAVDLVVAFDADTPIDLITALRPDVLVKGADYRVEQVVGADFVSSYGGEVFLAPLSEGQSTTGTITRMRKLG